MTIQRAYIRLLLGVVGITAGFVFAQAPKQVIPHAQKSMPNPAYTPAEAIKRMKVPEGFTVEVVACEPDLVNPVAFTIDERGRFWVVESLEYPRLEPGKGKDRVKILEDTDNDGKIDKVTIFAEGLNIPSGIAVGHGGVWVVNSPDLLLLQDTDNDGKADKSEVIVTGFGREDTHELPNSLTWGPDGWLYGFNGVFNRSKIKHQGKEHNFTCALFRIHPKTREFELFAEGVSNPWGVAFDKEGSAFASACVIDHLWHLAESGYYHRQAGVYPPFTWKLNSIVKHKHQMAAYCGLTYFDSEAYPEEYREVLYMGNIHGGCINADKLERQGSSYFATPRNDLLTANDAWFMPVGQKTGPDGCLYILDWYDRYHCYQDARRDPAGIDRERGRLYRLRYKETPRATKFDLATDSDEVLLKHLGNPNIYFRENAQRLLIERLSNAKSPGIRPKIEAIVLDDKANHKARMHALWVLVSSGPLPEVFHLQLLSNADPLLRSWGIRSAGNTHQVSQEIRTKLKGMANDASKDVLLQLAIAAKKITALDAPKVLSDVLANADKDMVIASIVWQNLQPLLDTANVSETFLKAAEANPSSQAEAALLGKFAERMLAGKVNPEINIALLSLLIKDDHQDSAKQVIQMLSGKLQSGDLKGKDLETLRSGLTPVLGKASSWIETKILKASWNDADALGEITKVLENPKADEPSRIMAFDALVAINPANALNTAKVIITEKNTSIGLRGNMISALGKLQDPAIADMVIALYPTLDPNVQPRAIELLSQRNTWSNKLLDAMAAKKIPTTAMGTNQARKMMADKDPELKKKVLAVWGTVREGRDPARESILANMRSHIIANPGDPKAGRLVFNKVCGQCHKMHGEGQEVGPDITLNGRANFEQLLSNVLDPSLVIGADYQATSVVTTKGRLLTGLMVEDSTTKISLKVQGGKVEVIPRAEVEEVSRSKNSLMPEGLEKQINPKEMADLFGYLILDKPPEDPKAKKIPGAP